MGASVSYRASEQAGVSTSTKKSSLTKFGQWWIGGLFVAMSTSRLFPLFDHTTDLTPQHQDIFINSFCLGLAMAVLTAGVAISEGRGKWWVRVLTVVFAFVCGLGGTFVISCETGKWMADAHDFPAGKTRTYSATWQITGLHQSHSRHSDDYYIETNLSKVAVSLTDYEFLIAHAGSGAYCARVPLESAGDAVRLMLGAHDELPSGNIAPCEQDGLLPQQ